MRSNFLCLFLLGFLAGGCAKPNYQDEVPAPVIQPEEKPAAPETPERCKLFFARERLCASITWDGVPKLKEMGSFDLKFFVQEKPDEFRNPSLAPAVTLWMPSMGHGSSPVVVEKKSDGVFHASRVFFLMPGSWEIRLQLKDGKDVVEQIDEKINL